MTYILRFDEVGKDNIPQVGGKGANLGEMVSAGLPVPPGFCVTAQAYRDFLTEAGLQDPINEILADMQPDDMQDVKARSEKPIVQVGRDRCGQGNDRPQEAVTPNNARCLASIYLGHSNVEDDKIELVLRRSDDRLPPVLNGGNRCTGRFERKAKQVTRVAKILS